MMRNMGTKHLVSVVCIGLAAVLLGGLPRSVSAQENKSLPIIPGAHGFGMETPAGSGRHLDRARLKPGWDAALVAHWNFDDGRTVGTLEGDAAFVERGQGRALRVSGKGSLSLAKPDGYVKPDGSFTVMAWVCMEKPLGAIAENAVDGGGNWYLGHVRHGIQKWMFGAKGQDGAYNHALWVRDVKEPKWRHVAGVYDGATGDMRLYINASQVARASGKLIKNLPAAQSSRLTLGKGLTGLIDDVMFFSAALTQEQILAVHADQRAAYLGANKTTVYKVTNLNTEGPGSLREALEAVGPRVVVFEVSGNIDFTPYGRLSIPNPYITVAGQTAPSPGITLKGCELVIGTHDVLLQHIRVRTGDLLDPKQPVTNKAGWTQFSERDCMKLDGHHIVIDHCSFSWSTDENVQSGGNYLTYRHNIISEGLNSSKHHKGGHSKGLIFRGEDNTKNQQVAVIGNLFAHNHGRNPLVEGAARAVVINNLIYDAWLGIELHVITFTALHRDANPLHISATVGNHVIEGQYGRTFIPSYRGDEKVVVRQRTASDRTINAVWFLDRCNSQPGKVFINDLRVSYTDKDGKYVQEVLKDPYDSRFTNVNKTWMGKPLDPMRSVVREPAVIVPGLQILPSAKVEDWVLVNAGARPADRDPVDARVVKSVRERTGTIPASQADVGGWPELAKSHRELTLPENPSADNDGDGYTNLEEWLHAFAAGVEGRDATRGR